MKNYLVQNIYQLDPAITSKEVQDIIQNASGKAAALAALPIPIIDIASVSLIQINMMNKLSAYYGVEKEDNYKPVITSLISAVIIELVTVAVEEIAKQVNIDKVLGESVVKGSLAGLLTTMTGEVSSRLLSEGKSLDELEFSSFTNYFSDQLQSNRWSPSSIGDRILDSIEQGFNIS